MKKALNFILFWLFVLILTAQINDPWFSPVYIGGGMSLVAKVQINGVDASTDDVLSVFVNQELRAKTNLINYTPPVSGVGRVFLIQTVNPNEVMTFKVWDNSAQMIYICNTTIQSNPGGTVGSYPNNIFLINCTTPTHTITGQITLNNQPLSNIQFQIENSSFSYSLYNYKCSKTDINGNYALPGIPSQASLTFRPVNELYQFTPNSQILNNIDSNHTQNFSANLLVTHFVSGYIFREGQGISGAIITSGDFQAISNQEGFYQLSLIHGTSPRLTVTKTGWEFNPSFIQLSNLDEDLPNQNFTASEVYFTINGSTSLPQTILSVQSSNQNIYASVESDENGVFTIPNIKYNDSIVITPAKEGYSFIPLSRTFNNILSDQICNFNHEIAQFTMSGYVLLDNQPLQSVTIETATQQVNTNLNGFYTFTMPYYSNFTITPRKIGYTFTPISSTITMLSTNQTINFSASLLPQYTLSGYVRISDNIPVPACTVSTPTNSVLTDQNGFYSLSQYQSNESVVLQIQKYGFQFSPAQYILPNIMQDNDQLDFTATYNNYTLSGMISGADSVLVNLSGSDSSSITTSFDHSFQFNFIPYLSSVSITPSKAHYHFDPVSRIINPVESNINNLNFTALIDQYDITVLVLHHGAPLSNVQVNYNGNISYTNQNGQLVFPVNHGSNCTIQVSKPGYFFVTPSITLSQISNSQSVQFTTRNPMQYTISGFVTDTNNLPISNVAVLSTYPVVYTNAQGGFSLSVQENSNIEITPQKNGYQFTPTTVSYNSITENKVQNFLGTIRYLSVSGTILYNEIGLVNVNVGYNSYFTNTDVNGNYTFSIPYGSNVTIKPDNIGYCFTPDSLFISNITTDLSDINFIAQRQRLQIRGLVKLANQPLPNVRITSMDSTLEVITNSQGRYQYPAFYGDNIVLIPLLDGYGFDPASYTLNNVIADRDSINFSAIAYVTPVQFMPSEGLYYAPINVQMTSATPNASIYYTIDGTEPTAMSTLYIQPLPCPLNSQWIIKAKAYKTGYLPSITNTVHYVITGQSLYPLVNYESGMYNHSLNVEIISPDSSQIYYTLDGTEPTEASPIYQIPIFVNNDLILKARAFKMNFLPSQTKTCLYTFDHNMSFNLPDSIFIQQTGSLSLNLLNYLTDSVSGTHPYSVDVFASNHINYSLNNMILTLSSLDDWYGSETINIAINLYNGQRASKRKYRQLVNDSLRVIIVPDNYPPTIMSYQPLENPVNIGLNQIINFIVTANDPDDPLHYNWFVNNVLQSSDQSSFSYYATNSGTYHIRCEISDLRVTVIQAWVVNVSLNNEDVNSLPHKTALFQNYPNPFNPETCFNYSLAKDAFIEIQVFDIKGKKVKSLVKGFKKKGNYSIKWDGKSDHGISLPSGIYLYKMMGSDFMETKKAILLK